MTKRTNRKASSGLATTPVSPCDALVKSLDLVATDMEARYGAGILPTLCTPETAGRFMKVNAALTEAIRSGDYDKILLKVASLKRGWLKMEEEAKASGYLKHVEAWYVASPEDGICYIICKHEADSAILAAQNPKQANCIYTLADIARLLENASVTRMTPKELKYFKGEAKQEFEGILNDTLPF